MLSFTFDEFMTGFADGSSPLNGARSLILYDTKGEAGTKKGLKSDLDLLREHPEVDVVTVIGLRQKTFEYFIKTYGKKLRAVRFFKFRSVYDLSLLGTLPDLEYVDLYQNHRAIRLWDMKNNRTLSGLSIRDFSRLSDLGGISSAPGLKDLIIGNTHIRRMILPSLKALSGSGIRRLVYNGKALLDCDLSFLGNMPALRTYDFPSNLYTTEEVAWIAANYPEISGASIRPYIEFAEKNLSQKTSAGLGKVVGRNKPLLPFAGNEKRLRGYAEAFDTYKNSLKGKTYKEAFGAKTKRQFPIKRAAGIKRKK